MRRQVKVELARLRGRRPVLVALAAGAALAAGLAVAALRDILGHGADAAAAGEGRGITLVALLAVLALTVGAGTAGGDWSTGSMRAQLLADPRRSRLWVAKCLAVTGGALGASVLLVAGFWAGVLVPTAVDGRLPAATAAGVAWFSARALALVALAALGGQALVLAVRFTAAAVVLVLVAVLASDALAGLLPLPRSGQWGLRVNVLAWLHGGTRVLDPQVRCPPAARLCDRHYDVALAHGAACLGALLAVTLVVSWLTFRRRAVP